MKNRMLLIAGLLILASMIARLAPATNPIRQDFSNAKDSSVIPNNETDLTKITISDDNDHTVDLSGFHFYPLILLVRADGNFHDGSNAPSQSNDLWRDSGQIWAIAVNGRQTWHFKRQTGAGTINIYLKALGSN